MCSSDLPRGFRDGPPPRLARERSISPQRFEGELSSRRAEMRRIRDDNQHLVDEIVGLRQAMPRLKEDLNSLSQAIPKLRAEKELESRELTQRNLKLEAELRSLEPSRQDDALQVLSEAGTLHFKIVMDVLPRCKFCRPYMHSYVVVVLSV